VRLTSPLNRAQCIDRLREGIDSPWRIFGSRPIIGQVCYSHASIRRRVRYHHVFRLCLEVILVEGATATGLVCRPGLHPLIAVFTHGWFGMLVAGAGLIALFAAAGGLLQVSWPLIAAPLAALVVIALAFMAGRRRAAEEQTFLVAYVSSQTKAVPI
jgi:hypothetical protein